MFLSLLSPHLRVLTRKLKLPLKASTFSTALISMKKRKKNKKTEERKKRREEKRKSGIINVKRTKTKRKRRK